MSETLKLYLVEDHKIVRDGLRAMLLGNAQIKIEKEFPRGLQFLEEINTIEEAAIVILDLGLPDISGIEIAKKVSEHCKKIKVIVLSANNDQQSISEAIKAGVSGFLAKDCSKEEFLEALQVVSSGEEYYSQSISKIMQKAYSSSLRIEEDLKSLSEREIEVIKLVSEGLSYKEIGDKLCISSRTVESHRHKILEKLKLKNNIDIVKYAVKNNLTSV